MSFVTDTIAKRAPMQRHDLEVSGKLYGPDTVQRDWACPVCDQRLRYTASGYRCGCGPVETGAQLVKASTLEYRRKQEAHDQGEYHALARRTARLMGGQPMAAIKDRKPQSVGLSRAGMIRLGAKVPVIDKRTGKQKTWRNGKPATRPVDLEYFRLDDAPAVASAYLPDENGYMGHKIMKDEHGAGPTELLIYLPFGDPDRNFDASYEYWQAGGCYCRGDGEYIQKAFDGEGLDLLIRDGEVLQDYHDDEWSLQKGWRVPCSGSGETRYWDRCAQCRLSAVMRVLVRDPRNPTQLVADELRYYQIRTHSGITHDRLVQQIAQYGHMAARFGMALPGIPFRLLRIPETMSYVAQDKNGERYRTQSDHALMSLEPDEEWVRVITEMSHKAALSLSAPTVAPPAALPAGTVEYEIVEEPDEPDGYDHSWQYEESEEGEQEDDPRDLVIDPLEEARGISLSAFGNGDWADRTVGDCNADQLIWVIEKCQERPKWTAGKRIAEAAGLVLDAIVEEDALQDAVAPFAPLEWPSEQAREKVIGVLMLNKLLTPAGKPQEAEALLANAADAGALDGVDLNDTKAVETVLVEWVEAWRPDDGEGDELPGMPEPEKPARKSKGKVN